MSKIDILKIAKEAQIHKKKDNSVVDATIGMFYDDQLNMVIPDVAEAYKNLDLFETFKYGATDGGKVFEDNVINWVLSSKKEKLATKFQITGLSTPGGSGALSVIFNTYGKINDKVLVSNLRWRYEYFTKVAKKEVHEFNLFKENAFDLEDFKNQLSIIAKTQTEIIVVLNDPCHNPTGYQLTSSEWKSVINITNQFKNNKIYLVHDLAYFDYDPRGFEQARTTFDYFMDLNDHVEVLICFSASKSFAMYGLRLGGLIGLHHTTNQFDYFKKNAIDDALGKWSTAPSVGIGIFNQLSLHKDKYLVTLERLTGILKIRGDIFLKEARANDLNIFPYKGGFFVLIKTDNAERDFIRLKDQKIYVIPMAEGLRVALSCVTTKEVYGLAKRIKDIIQL